MYKLVGDTWVVQGSEGWTDMMTGKPVAYDSVSNTLTGTTDGAFGGMSSSAMQPDYGISRLEYGPSTEPTFNSMKDTEAAVQSDITNANQLNPDNWSKEKSDVMLSGDTIKDTESGFGFNSKTLGSVVGIGQLGLGIAEYLDKKDMNKQTMEEKKFNLAQARNDAAVDAKYRASYGA